MGRTGIREYVTLIVNLSWEALYITPVIVELLFMKSKALIILLIIMPFIGTFTRNNDTIQSQLYISPDGDDNNIGTEAYPLKSLARANDILEHTKPEKDVIVKLISDRGPYIDQCVSWTYCNSSYSLIFESYPPTRNARFIPGNNLPEKTFFSFYADRGEATNITIRNVTISDYCSRAILFIGDRENRNKWNGNNVIEDCVFENIGNLMMPDKPIVYSVIGFVNSRNNEIRDCLFSNISNCTAATFPQKRIAGLDRAEINNTYMNVLEYETSDCFKKSSNPNLPIIGIYIAHHSDSNTIRNCTFLLIKGDAIRIRDDSNYTCVVDNVMEIVGWHGVVTTWYCNTKTGACTKNEPERPSRNIYILGNAVRGNWLYGMPRIYYDINSNSHADESFYDTHSISIEGNTLSSFRYR